MRLGYVIQTEALRRLGLDADFAGLDAEELGDALAQLAGDRDDLGLRHHEHGVDVDDAIAGGGDLFERRLQKDGGGCALPARIAGREEGADVAGGDRAEQCVGDGVQQQSPSEWPARPSGCSMARPPMISGTPGLKAWESNP